MVESIIKRYSSVIEKSYPDIERKNLKLLADGFDFYVISVNDEMAFRFPRSVHDAEKLPRETAFLRLFAPQSPIQVPNLTLHTLPDNIPYVTYPFIKGIQFKEQVKNTFSSEEMHEAAQKLGEFFSCLHAFPKEKAKELGVIEEDYVISWRARYESIKQLVFPQVSESEKVFIDSLFSRFLELIDNTPIVTTVTHADISSSHILIDSAAHTLAGVIDFADMRMTDPAYEFRLLREYGDDFLSNVYHNYTGPMDPSFELRRQFYEDIYNTTIIEHALKIEDEGRLIMGKNLLAKQVSRS